jgi:hypothetical protein
VSVEPGSPIAITPSCAAWRSSRLAVGRVTPAIDATSECRNAVYQELGEHLEGVHYVAASSSVLDNGEWTDTLPRLPVEPCPDSGALVNSARAPGGLHFCPASAEADRRVTGDCPVWSRGAFRYGNAVAQLVLESLAAMNPAPRNGA